jgi:predicted nucleic acid-binding protein
MSRFVLDASVAGCWAFSDEEHAVAAKALDMMRTGQAVAPSLWWFEVRNILIVNERRGRLVEADTATFTRLLSRLPVTIDQTPDETAVLALARQHKLTVYDATYLELAARIKVPLATLDTALRAAAKAADVRLVA